MRVIRLESNYKSYLISEEKDYLTNLEQLLGQWQVKCMQQQKNSTTFAVAEITETPKQKTLSESDMHEIQKKIEHYKQLCGESQAVMLLIALYNDRVSNKKNKSLQNRLRDAHETCLKQLDELEEYSSKLHNYAALETGLVVMLGFSDYWYLTTQTNYLQTMRFLLAISHITVSAGIYILRSPLKAVTNSRIRLHLAKDIIESLQSSIIFSQ